MQSVQVRFLAAAILLMCGVVVSPSIADSQTSGHGLPEVDRIVMQAIEQQKMPGCVVMIGTSERVLHQAAYGHRQLLPTPEPAELSTLYDLASLTKPVATATCILLLSERGQLNLEAPVCHSLPEFAENGKDRVTIHHLLTHTSGLIADNALRDYQSGDDATWKNLCRLKLTAPPGEKFIYSDVGFIVLGKLVEAVSGQPLNEFANNNLFQPTGMTETGYVPKRFPATRFALTEQRDGMWTPGIVHDPRAFAMGGIAGHAGLFATASDLSRYARVILGRGEIDGQRVLARETVDAMLVSRPVPGGGIRTWGWDRQTGFSSNRGDGMSAQAIGHGGFTGTGLWIDPDRDLYVIFLSNRVHPNGKGSVNRLIGEIGGIAVKSLSN